MFAYITSIYYITALLPRTKTGKKINHQYMQKKWMKLLKLYYMHVIQ